VVARRKRSHLASRTKGNVPRLVDRVLGRHHENEARAKGHDSPSTVTCRSSMASSSAAWTSRWGSGVQLVERAPRWAKDGARPELPGLRRGRVRLETRVMSDREQVRVALDSGRGECRWKTQRPAGPMAQTSSLPHTPAHASMRRCPAASTAVVAATTAPRRAEDHGVSDLPGATPPVPRASSSDGFTVASLTRSSVVMDNTHAERWYCQLWALRVQVAPLERLAFSRPAMARRRTARGGQACQGSRCPGDRAPP